MVQCTSLAPRRPSRYGNAMSSTRPSAADALLRLWLLAGIALAGLELWLAWQMHDWPADLPGPQPLRAVEVTKFMAWFVVVPAAVVVFMRWRATRDRALLGLALFLGFGSAASFAAWAQADTAGMALVLHIADAVIALAGAGVALRALRQS